MDLGADAVLSSHFPCSTRRCFSRSALIEVAFPMLALEDIAAARQPDRRRNLSLALSRIDPALRDHRRPGAYANWNICSGTGSFKERGARNALLELTPQHQAAGVVAASAGNHALGLAYHGASAGDRHYRRNA